MYHRIMRKCPSIQIPFQTFLFTTNKWALETRIFRVAKIRMDIHNIEVLSNHI